MIIDHRTYTLKHGKLTQYLDIFKKDGLPIQLKHLGNLIGYFQTAIGAQNQVVHLWGYESLADMELRRKARDADPAWLQYKEKTSGMLYFQENKIIIPTSFSPLR